MLGTLRSRSGAGGSECASERECERVLALGWADRHVGRAGGARQPSPRPPPPTAPSLPRPVPARCPYREAPPQRVLRRPLPLSSQPVALGRPLSPTTPLPAPTTAESAGESRLGSPATRGRHRGGGPGLVASGRLSSGRWDRTGRRLLTLLGLQKPGAHPKEVFF